MSTSDPVGGGRGGVRWWRGMRVRLHRPARTGKAGLLLVLTVLVAVMALVDEPVQPGPGWRLPGIYQVLPPPVGIIQPRPWVAPSPAGSGRLARQAGGDELLQRTPRRHPHRQHPRPGQRRVLDGQKVDSLSRPVHGLRWINRPEAGRRPPALQAA